VAGHYTTWLVIPGIIGLAFQIVVGVTGNFSHPVIPFYCLFVALWAIFMLEFWKRREKYTAMRWGMVGFESEQVDRPQYKGTEEPSYINGAPMTYFSPKYQKYLITRAFTIIISLAVFVLGAVVSIYVIRHELYLTMVGQYAQLVASVLNSIQITIFNIIYGIVATKLTNNENHRYDSIRDLIVFFL
jgi:hypothetical protein